MDWRILQSIERQRNHRIHDRVIRASQSRDRVNRIVLHEVEQDHHVPAETFASVELVEEQQGAVVGV